MGEAPLGVSETERTPADQLDSWKEIAAYLKRDVTTVQRWEKREGMPVHRHQHDRLGSIYASRAELDAWSRSRNQAQSDMGNGAPPLVSAPAATDARFAPRPISRDPFWRRLSVSLATLAALALVAAIWLRETKYSWKNPIAGARFQTITDFDGVAEGAAISRDNHLVAFLSDRDGPMDVWVTQVGSGEYHNLTHGSIQGLVNSSIRTPSFSPDASVVSFWVRKMNGLGNENTSTWAVPTLGGHPTPYLDGVAEFDWSRDGSQLAFHTSSPGDPLYLSKDGRLSDAQLVFKGPDGLHSHFPLWSPDGAFIYFVHGSVPDKLDIWRIPSSGGSPERITFQNSQVTYPVFLDGRTLLYLATDADGSGPWLYGLDVERRVAHRLTSGPERYTSLSASADGRHLVLALANPTKTLWRLSMAASAPQPALIPLSTVTGFSARLGPAYLLYVSTVGTGDAIWKFAQGTGTQLWRAPGARIIGAPAISSDGRSIAFSAREDGRSVLSTMQADGTNVHILSSSLDLDGAPAWSPDSRFVTTAVKDHGAPHLVQVPVDGRSPSLLVAGYSIDPHGHPIAASFSTQAPTSVLRFL